MFKIEFPAERTDIALAIGQALVAIGKGEALVNSPAASTAPKSADTATASAGETVKTTAADTATDQDNQAANDSAPAHGATDQAGSADTNAPAGAGPKDEKGVTKDDKYCASAKDPFYGSGKKKGQWKKRQGVDEAEYDAWYAEQLAAVETEPAPEAEFDTSNAFGGAQTNNPDSDMPQNGEDFMVWLAEKKTAGKITEEMVDEAWQSTGVQVGFIFTGSLIKENIAAMYYTLKYGINSPQAQQAMQALV